MNDTRDVELNAIGVLKRREIEARILAPLVDALSRKFDREKVLQIVRETIVGIAKDQGRQLVQISAGAPDRARQPAGRRHHAGVLAGMGASTVLQLPDRRSRRGTLSRRLTRCRRLPTISARRSSVPAFWHRPSEEC